MKINYYKLRTKHGAWLGDIVLAENGFFAAVTDWGNFSFYWGSTGEGTLEDFICSLNIDYFASKMLTSISYSFGTSKKNKDACYRFAEGILPALQKELSK